MANRTSLASDNAKKIGRILKDREGHADLYRTAVGGPSGQRSDIMVGRVRYTWEEPFEVTIIAMDGPFAGERSGYARREGGRWSIYDDRENEGVHYIGTATSLSLGVDVLHNGLHVATGRHDSKRLSGGTFEPYKPTGTRDREPAAPSEAPAATNGRTKPASKATPEGFELLSGWAPDDSPDPCSRVRHARYRGRTWRIRNLNPGWWMFISVPGTPRHVGMPEWENWTQTATAIDEYLERA